MSVLWVVPLLVFAAGAILIAGQLRKSSVEMDALRGECRRLSELNDALADLRHTADVTRASVDDIRSRGSRRTVDR